jgi:hypothetical protein
MLIILFIVLAYLITRWQKIPTSVLINSVFKNYGNSY